MFEMIIYQLFSLGSSFKASCRIVIQGSSLKDKSFPTIDKFSMGDSNFLKLAPTPYIEININNTYDRKNGQSKLKKMNFTRRDVCTMIHKLKKLVNNLFTDNKLFFKADGELKVDHQKADEMKLVHQNQSNYLEMRPIVVPYNNDLYEGVLYTYGGNYEYYTYLTSYEVLQLLYEFEHMDFNNLALNMLNAYIINKEKPKHEIETKETPLDIEVKETELVDIKPKQKNSGVIPNI